MRKSLGSLFLIIFLVFFVYFNSLHSPFLWDDEVMVVQNPLIKSWRFADDIFKFSAFGERWDPGKFYRPLQIFSYLIDYSLWKNTPFGYHLTNVSLHAVNAALVFWLLTLIFQNGVMAFISTLLFAIHPVHIEAVTYISGRGDLIFLCLSLISFITFLLALKGRRALFFLSFLSAGLAFISKENALPLPLIMTVYGVLMYRSEVRRVTSFIFLSLLNMTAMGYVLYRMVGLKGQMTGTYSEIALASFTERLMTIPHLLVTYIRLLFFPHPLHMEYHFVEKHWVNPYLWIGLPIIAIGFGLGLAFMKRKADQKKGVFFLLFFFLGLGTVYHIPVPLAATLREHWLYLPSIGMIAFCVLLGKTVISRYPHPFVRHGFIVLAFVFGAGFTYKTIERNEDWKDPLLLYEHDLRLEPKSFVLHNNAGVIYYRMGLFKEAKKAFVNAVQASPFQAYGTAYNNLGVILEAEGEVEDAVTHYKTSIQTSQYQLAYRNLARIYTQQGKNQEAISLLEEAIIIHPLYNELYYLLSSIYLSQEEKEKARTVLLKLRERTGKF